MMGRMAMLVINCTLYNVSFPHLLIRHFQQGTQCVHLRNVEKSSTNNYPNNPNYVPARELLPSVLEFCPSDLSHEHLGSHHYYLY